MGQSYKDALRDAAAEFTELWSQRLRRLSKCPACGNAVGRPGTHVCKPKTIAPPCRECGEPSIARRLCLKHYHQWYRRKNGHLWLKIRKKPHQRLCIKCRERESRAHGRCTRCYLHYRKENPNQCDCGRFYRKGTKCAACYKRDQMAKTPKCACGTRPILKKHGKCRTCLNLENGLMCTKCDRGLPVATSNRCSKCVYEDYRQTESGKRTHRRGEFKRRQRQTRERSGVVRRAR